MIHLLALILLAAGALAAQRHELSMQFGGTLTQRRTISLPSNVQNLLGTDALREDNGYAGGIVYRVRLVRFGNAALMAEVPVFLVQATNTDLIPLFARPTFGGTSGISFFATPAGVVRFAPESRVSPYLFFGGGYARVVEAQIVRTSPCAELLRTKAPGYSILVSAGIFVCSAFSVCEVSCGISTLVSPKSQSLCLKKRGSVIRVL